MAIFLISAALAVVRLIGGEGVIKGAAKVQRLLEEMWQIKVNESWYKQRGVARHFSTGKNLLKIYWQKMNIGTIN